LKFQQKIIKVKTGLEHILALTDLNSGGKVFSWGCSKYGQLGIDTNENV
jgi:alpha-tubulin suppressor-like RCC1 family protein